ncbi:MAG: DUF4147 domain-containing protein [Candidatus Aminicenantes bacterium]|nr:DUF4147 domain-containing protein [Candidatus Aminicenantes bacterium]
MSGILSIFHAALAGADPFRLVSRRLRLEGKCLAAGALRIDLDAFAKVLVIGAGKAAAGMGLAAESVLGGRIGGGLLALPAGAGAPFRRVSQIQASHPLPDAGGEEAARRILSLLAAADEKTFVLCLLSGGGSAMLAAPAPGLTLADKRETTTLLLRAGAAIDEINAVRKHLSSVKGGRLAQAAFPATVLALAISDVVGDRPEVIASGPACPDPDTFAGALSVLDKFGLRGRIPARARMRLERGAAGLEEETAKPGDPRLGRSTCLVVGNIGDALRAAREEALRQEMTVEIVASEQRGEARDAARFLAAQALRTRAGLGSGERRCLLCGGETTVTVRAEGRGGRNQELALAFAMEIAGESGIEMLSAATDGVDGPTDAAGAIVDGGTVSQAARLGLDAARYLERNDSHTFFMELDYRSGERRLLRTGPSGTNVADLQVILLSDPGKG